MFQVCWRQHGGSGLGASMSEVLELPVSDRDWLIERIGQQRSRVSAQPCLGANLKLRRAATRNASSVNH